MPRSDLEKNRLDLAYQRQLQFLNAILIIGTGSVIAYFGGLILNLNRFYEYSVILIIIILSTGLAYKKVDKNLKEISNNISKLK